MCFFLLKKIYSHTRLKNVLTTINQKNNIRNAVVYILQRAQSGPHEYTKIKYNYLKRRPRHYTKNKQLTYSNENLETRKGQLKRSSWEHV